MSILVVGSVAYDSVKTPFGEATDVLGGSITFFSAAATHLSPVKIVGVVGNDFNPKDYAFLKKRGADIQGLQTMNGETFKWKGIYEGDMNEAKTLSTCLNVFEHFSPELSSDYQKSTHIFLGNIDPTLQLKVLGQVKKPKLSALDTMNFWINTKQDELRKVISKVDLLIMNDREALSLTKAPNIISSAKDLIKCGPKAIIIKKGEHGSYLRYGSKQFILPAFPLEKVVDPTGAGDSFAGGVMGYLAMKKEINFNHLKKAMIYGTLMASFNVQDFSITKLKNLKKSELNARYKSFLQYLKI